MFCFVFFSFSFIATTQYPSSGLLNSFLNYISAHNIYPSICACVISPFSHVQFCVTLWTVLCQAPLFMGFSREEYQSGLACPPPEDLPNPRGRILCLWCLYSLSLVPPRKPLGSKSIYYSFFFFPWKRLELKKKKKNCCSFAYQLVLIDLMDRFLTTLVVKKQWWIEEETKGTS